AVGMDIDAAGLVTLGQMGRSVAPMDSEALASVIAFVHKKGYRFIVKGIMTPRDAQKAVDAGADAIVVSNHGGRILDHCPGTAAVLPRIAEAVRGRTAIIADGAVRTGTHVLKMLALGADAVFVGRPVCIAAVGGSAAGVREYFDGIADQLGKAMLLTGAGTIADITGSMLFNGGD
ncbi:MAG: alpha-hydroxy-acid oxidizing protein, partial [Mailhella sp.]|nr:alpha-hydroxy-acid oxidizing protein [Mailhella sp.]